MESAVHFPLAAVESAVHFAVLQVGVLLVKFAMRCPTAPVKLAVGSAVLPTAAVAIREHARVALPAAAISVQPEWQLACASHAPLQPGRQRAPPG